MRKNQKRRYVYTRAGPWSSLGSAWTHPSLPHGVNDYRSKHITIKPLRKADESNIMMRSQQNGNDIIRLKENWEWAGGVRRSRF